MKTGNLLKVELTNSFVNGKSLSIKLGYAYLIGIPFALIRMTVNARVLGVVVLILFTSFFGAATTIVSRRSDGILGKLRLLPIRSASFVLDFLLSGAIVDFLQVGVVIGLLLLVNGSSVSFAILAAIAGTFVLSVLLLNLLGMVLGFYTGGSQEVYLIGSLGAGLIGFLAGLYPVSGRIERVIDWTSRFIPLRYLADTLRLSMPASGDPVNAIAPWQTTASLVLIGAVLFAIGMRLFGRK